MRQKWFNEPIAKPVCKITDIDSNALFMHVYGSMKCSLLYIEKTNIKLRSNEQKRTFMFGWNDHTKLKAITVRYGCTEEVELMSIELTRVDFRLIHGQVITRWLTQCQINEIVTIDNELNKDPFMQEVFKMAAPKGVKITIVDEATAVAKQQAGDFDKKRVMILFKGVSQLNSAVQAGLKLDKVQIGGLGGGPGRKAVNNAITLDRTDADILLGLEKQGIEIYFQTTPDYPSETLQKAVAKL